MPISRSLCATVLATSAVAIAALTACAPTPPYDSPSGVPSSPATSVSAHPSSPPTVITGLDALTSYRGLAKESCTYAQSSGVVETIIAAHRATSTLVMIPKDQAYQDFSAAYYVAPNDFETIFETDAFASCADDMTFSMSEDAGTPLSAIKGIAVSQRVDGDTADPTFTVTYTADGDTTTTRYTAHDNLIVKADEIAADGTVTSTRTVRYGTTEKDRAIVVTATDRYLAKK